MFRGERINVTEDRAVLHTALRLPRERSLVGRRARRRPRRARGARPDGALRRRACAPARGSARPARRSAPSSTSGSAAPTSGRPWPTRRSRHYTPRDTTSASSRTSTRTDVVEAIRDLDPAETLFIVASKTFTTARDDDERATPCAGWLVAALGEDAVAAPLRRALDEPRGGRRVRDRPREHVRVLGLGRRPLLDGLGDRALDDDRDRPRALRASCSPASTRSTSTSPHAPARAQPAGADGPARRLEPQLLRLPDAGRAALRRSTCTASPPTCSSSTMESNGKSVTLDGDPVGVDDRADRLGRARHERPAHPSTSCSTRGRPRCPPT